MRAAVLTKVIYTTLLVCFLGQFAHGTEMKKNLRTPFLVGHRGSPKYFPEHSVPGYAQAIRESLDYIEPDLVLTKDGHLVVMHDIELSTTTDVASRPEFADRKKTVTFDSNRVEEGWLVNDFTLEEVKSLRVKQRSVVRDNYLDGFLTLLTFEEFLQFARQKSEELGIEVGIYIEMKHTPYFNKHGLYFEDKVLAMLEKYNYPTKGEAAKNSRVVIQSFESSALRRFRKATDLRLIQLVDEPHWLREDSKTPFWEMLTPKGLDEIAEYADGVSPWKWFFFTPDAEFIAALDPSTITGQKLVTESHRRNLEVHTWTFRNKYEDARLVKFFDGSSYFEHLYYFELGVDAVFTESPTDAVLAREEFWRRTSSEDHHTGDSSNKNNNGQQHQQSYIVYALLFIAGLLVGGAANRGPKSDILDAFKSKKV